jgi:Calcineurin-like phosphoesterase
MPSRILDLTSGLTMVISDLHGDRDAFARYVGRFLQLYNRKKLQRFLILGDLIHSKRPGQADESLQLVTDVMRMQKALPPGTVVMLLGNHEMPHLYSVSLAQGNTEYSPPFEQALSGSGKRAEIMAFFDSLPFYVRTAAGVLFTHAGPDGNAMINIEKLRNFDHHAVLSEFDHALSLNPHPDQLRALYGQTMGLPYEMLARFYLAVSGPDDPRYDDLIRAYMISKESKEFELLWDALFTRGEQSVSMALYERLLAVFLEALSYDAPAPQRFLVSGHLDIEGGHKTVTDQHLRLASAAHALPREAGQYLLLDFGQPVTSMDTLVNSLGSVFKEGT